MPLGDATMNDLGILLSGSFGLAVIIFLIVLAILWFALPFAVFGSKKLLRTQINNQIDIHNNQLEIIEELKRIRKDLNPSGSEEEKKAELRAER
jgi:hypothetical protein